MAKRKYSEVEMIGALEVPLCAHFYDAKKGQGNWH